MRRLLALFAVACMAIVSQPSFAQSQISLTGYVDANGHPAAVRLTTPLPSVNQPYALPGSRWQYAGATGGIVNTTAVALQAAGAAGIRNYVVACQFLNSSAVPSEVVIKDGTTIIWRSYLPATMAAPAQVTFPVPLRGTAATAMNVAMITTATATVVSCQGYSSAQ